MVRSLTPPKEEDPLVDFDQNSDKVPARPFPKTGQKFPTIAALKAAIAGSGVSASYPAARMHTLTQNDLIFICRTHSISVVGL